MQILNPEIITQPLLTRLPLKSSSSKIQDEPAEPSDYTYDFEAGGEAGVGVLRGGTVNVSFNCYNDRFHSSAIKK